MISIADDIGKVVQLLRSGTLAPYDDNDANFAPYYMVGHRQEIANRLSQKENDKVKKKKKYPLIALNTRHVPVQRGIVWDFNLNIIIGTQVDTNLTSEEREEQVFKPLLYPLFEAFKEAFSDSGLGFIWDSQLPQDFPPCSPLIQYVWGTESKEGSLKNVFNDNMSVIEIVNMKFSKVDVTTDVRKHS